MVHDLQFPFSPMFSDGLFPLQFIVKYAYKQM